MSDGLYIGMVALAKCFRVARENMDSRNLLDEQQIFTANISAVALKGNTPEKLMDAVFTTKEVGDDLLILSK